MDKDRIAGAGKQIKGNIKEVVGRVLGDAKLQEDGRSDIAEGKIQNIVGGLKDSAHDLHKEKEKAKTADA